MTRKVISMQVTPESTVIVLCDDGTIWFRHGVGLQEDFGLQGSSKKFRLKGRKWQWHQVEPLPMFDEFETDGRAYYSGFKGD